MSKSRKALIAVGILISCILIMGLFFIIQNAIIKSSNRTLHVIVVVKSIDPSAEYWQTVKDGVTAAAKEFNVDTKFEGTTSESDVDGQIKILDAAIKTKPDAIVMAADDDNRLIPEAEKIRRDGIKLITIDSGINSNISQSFIATDNVSAAKKEGQVLNSIMTKGKQIAIMSYVGYSLSAVEREQGLELGLSKANKDEIIGTYYSESSDAKAYQITKQLLESHPEIGGIAGLNEESTTGAAMAIVQMGLGGKVKIVGFDSSLEEIKYIEMGVIQATVVQEPFNMGYLGIKTAVQIIDGEKYSKKINTDSQLITKENMFTYENQRLLFPFVVSR